MVSFSALLVVAVVLLASLVPALADEAGGAGASPSPVAAPERGR